MIHTSIYKTVFNISKIQIESYSQLKGWILNCFFDCFQYFKDTNWKLFTTNTPAGNVNVTLFSIFQRYKLKAIHNKVATVTVLLLTVFNISKIQIESYSQLHQDLHFQLLYCFQYFKDTNWKLFTTRKWYCLLGQKLFSIFQRYKLKAIHNPGLTLFIKNITVFNISKIQIESYSQPAGIAKVLAFYCFQYFKDTNWKLFTTLAPSPFTLTLLFSIFQRYKLKAIHNLFCDW